MLNSRDINLLRPDVAANCRKLIAEMNARGYPVGVMTVRDDEYQADCYKRGTGCKPPATFHSVKAGLAFDVYKNVKHHEYDDPELFRVAGEIGKKLGFTWGGGWSKFADKPHFQWDNHGRCTGANITAGKYPPQMPIYEEAEDMTAEQVQEIVNRALADRDEAVAMANAKIATWAAEAWNEAKQAGIFDGTRPASPLTRQEAAVIMKRLGAVK